MKIDEEVEILFLEEIANAPHCEARHLITDYYESGAVKESSLGPCSHTPAAVFITCTDSLVVCLNYVLQIKARASSLCRSCKLPVDECFRFEAL